jgi:hypothetical protein
MLAIPVLTLVDLLLHPAWRGISGYARLQRMYQRDGVTVTLVEYGDQLVPFEARTR